MTVTYNPSNPSARGWLMAAIEATAGTVPSQGNFFGLPVQRNPQFVVANNIISPDEIRNTFAEVTDKSLGMETVDWNVSKLLRLEQDPCFLGGIVSPNPGSPGSLSASILLAGTAATSAGSLSLTSQPTNPMRVAVTYNTAGAPATALTITLTGTDENGRPVTETVVSGGAIAGSSSATYLSNTVFATISASGIVYTGGVAGGTLGVASRGGYSRTWTSSTAAAALQTFSFQHYDGGFTRQYAFGAITEADLSWAAEPNTPVTLALRGFAGGNSQISTPTYAAPVVDPPHPGWRVACFLDDPGGTPGTTQIGDVMSGSIKISTGMDRLNTNGNTRYFTKTKRKKRSISVSLMLDMSTTTEYDRMRTGGERILQVAFIGERIADTITSEIRVNIPIFYRAGPIDTASDNTMLQLSGSAFYDPTLAYDIQVTSNNTQPSSAY